MYKRLSFLVSLYLFFLQQVSFKLFLI